MAMILSIETSTKNCSVSIAKDGQQLCLVEEASTGYAHGEKLNQFIDWCLEGAEISLKDLDAICVSKGPGSYTGLRIGVSSAKGLAYGLSIPLLAIDSLAVLVEQKLNEDYDYIIPMIDARRMEVYTALYSTQGKQYSTTEAKVIDENSFTDLIGKKIVFIGDGAEKCQETLFFLNAEFVQVLPSASHMHRLAYHQFNNNLVEDIAYFEPYYLKEFVVEKKKPKENKK